MRTNDFNKDNTKLEFNINIVLRSNPHPHKINFEIKLSASYKIVDIILVYELSTLLSNANNPSPWIRCLAGVKIVFSSCYFLCCSLKLFFLELVYLIPQRFPPFHSFACDVCDKMYSQCIFVESHCIFCSVCCFVRCN